MQDEQNFKSLAKFGVRLEVIFIELIHHEQEVFHIREVLSRHIILSANSMAISISSNCRNISHQSVDLLVSNFFVFVDGLSH